MSEVIGRMLNKFNKLIAFHHKDLIHIEGGLGSQILGAISFWNLQKELGLEKAKCDLSYFSDDAQTPGLWPYELGRFNLHMSEFQKYERNSKLNLIKAKKDFLSLKDLDGNYWQRSRTEYLDKFKFDPREFKIYFQELADINVDEPFAAIHIRRGDYLQVASKLVQIDEYLQLIESIRKLFPKNVIIVSDSEVSGETRSNIESSLGNHKLIYLDSPGTDPFSVHCLLREAEVLVTANSTYSFSAGLLGREGQTVFSPMQFHSGEGSEKYNRTFRSAGSFFIWPTKG